MIRIPIRAKIKCYKLKFYVVFFLFVGCVLASKTVHAQNQKITRKNITFLKYPDFPEGTSTWDDIGYDSTYDKVFVAVTNHRNKQMLYAYDVDSGKFQELGLVTDLAHLRPFQHQGKVHSKFTEGPGGNMYFGTDGGAAREEYFMNNPRGYLGGYLLMWNPAIHKMTNFGMGKRFDSIKDVGVDPETGNIYAISYPQVHFLVYNPTKNKLQDLGRLGSAHVPRVMFTDWWGNCYYVDWRLRLVKYDKAKGGLIFAQKSLPAFHSPKKPGYVTITGITSYAKDRDDGIIYLITYGGKLIAFHPQKEGIGKIEDLGGVIPQKDLGPGIPPWRAYTPDLAFGKNGNLYYFVGSEGRYAQKGKCLFVEYNPETGKKRILFTYPTSRIGYVSGSNTTDKFGNMYFGAFRRVKKNGHTREIPFLIKFNPVKEVRK